MWMGKSRRSAEHHEEVARRCRVLRIAVTGDNATEFARLIGLNQQTWNNYETGIRRITPDAALLAAIKTGVSFDWIYRGLVSHLPRDLARAIENVEAGRSSTGSASTA